MFGHFPILLLNAHNTRAVGAVIPILQAGKWRRLDISAVEWLSCDLNQVWFPHCCSAPWTCWPWLESPSPTSLALGLCSLDQLLETSALGNS